MFIMNKKINDYLNKSALVGLSLTSALGSINASASNAQDHMNNAISTAQHNIEHVTEFNTGNKDLNSIKVSTNDNDRHFQAGAYQLYDAKGLCSYEAATDFANMYNFKEGFFRATVNWAAAYLTGGVTVGVNAVIAAADNCIDNEYVQMGTKATALYSTKGLSGITQTEQVGIYISESVASKLDKEMEENKKNYNQDIKINTDLLEEIMAKEPENVNQKPVYNFPESLMNSR